VDQLFLVAPLEENFGVIALKFKKQNQGGREEEQDELRFCIVKEGDENLGV
jgi:hypothetical protein